MPRTARSCSAGYTDHVLNRGNAQSTVFHKSDDYDAFVDLVAESSLRTPMRVLAYCLMPNHFHLSGSLQST
jgi:putative transposase